MKIGKKITLAAGFAVASFAFATPASAQATRTWVSGVGDDVNPCSRTAPCKTFAGAISKTAAGGEINCLDPGGFGTVTITKSIIIDCTGTLGSILNSGGINGIVVNDSLTGSPNTIDVVIRGIAINGAGTTPGLNGIRFISGRSLTVENVYIENQKTGSGIALNPAGAARFIGDNVTIVNGGNGVLVQPTGASGNMRATLRNMRIVGNTATGFKLDTTGATSAAGTFTTLENVLIARNANGVHVLVPGGASPTTSMIVNSTISQNTGTGLLGDGAAATVRVGNTTITGNATGVTSQNTSQLRSYGDNRNDGNSAEGAFVAPTLPKD
jgi:hypothetical protein